MEHRGRGEGCNGQQEQQAAGGGSGRGNGSGGNGQPATTMATAAVPGAKPCTVATTASAVRGLIMGGEAEGAAQGQWTA